MRQSKRHRAKRSITHLHRKPKVIVKYQQLDISIQTECTALAEAAVQFLGGLDSLIHATGHIHQDAAQNIDERELDRMLDINVNGLIFMTQVAFPYLKKLGRTILKFGSDLAAEPLPLLAHYAASKVAVQSFTRAIARDWRKYGVRIDAVLPAV
ncbi:Short-chain dehydrogenase/reductase SDR [Penicillium canescens]|nr:Short-chain dehydrogenase/reductase SDR [Penicillium canescens]